MYRPILRNAGPSLALGVLMVLAMTPGAAVAECTTPAGYAILVSPRSPVPGDTLRVLVAVEGPLENASLELTGPNGSITAQALRQGGGPPYWMAGEFPDAALGKHTLLLKNGGQTSACTSVVVVEKRRLRKKSKTAWATEQHWTRDMENLYSAWLEVLFVAPEGTSWRPLHQVTRDKTRNLLHNHLGLNEDKDARGGLKLTPDCADNPFYLRAYFSWKLGLPFGHHRCTRGNRKKGPECSTWVSNEAPRSKGGRVGSFYRFLRRVKCDVHAASARSLLDSDATDLYPVKLERESLRPGAVFADPFGHTLMLVRWLPQSAGSPGVLLAADAQPDGTVAIKRFWRGNFLFTTKDVIGGPGFKAFRPIARRHGVLKPLTNRQVAANPHYGDFSLEQRGMDTTAFFDRMERVVNPDPLDPVSAFRLLHEALHEQLRTRVGSVRNGEEWKKQHPGKTIDMPSGIRIFRTSGPWEDFSTPARDMRLLIAVDVLRDFPDRLLRTPEAFALPEKKTPKQMRASLLELHTTWSAELTITYERSDGSAQILSIADVLSRARALETAYNPNDCIEVRWGASEGSAECATCNRRAPKRQRAKVEKYRNWFENRRRPSW